MIKKRIYVFILLFLIILSNIAVYAEIISAFDKNINLLKVSFASRFNWDLGFNFKEDDWSSLYGDTMIPFERKDKYQKQFFEDNVETTLKYLDLFIDVNGEYGKALVEIARREKEEWDAKIQTSVGINKYNYWYIGEHCQENIAWCNVFVSWCANEAGLLGKDENGNPIDGVFPRTADCNYSQEYFVDTKGFASYSVRGITNLGGSDYTPKLGDIVIFAKPQFIRFRDGKPYPEYSHIGIVSDVSGDGYIRLIEGNACNEVREVTYKALTEDQISNAEDYYKDFYNGLIINIEFPNSESYIFNFLVNSMGLSKEAACGVIGNMMQESGCKADVLERDSEGEMGWDEGAGYGLIQWTNTGKNGRVTGGSNIKGSTDIPGRRSDLIIWCNENGYEYDTVEGQLNFLKYELGLYGVFIECMEKMKECPEGLYGVKEAAKLWYIYVEAGHKISDTEWLDKPTTKEAITDRSGHAEDAWKKLVLNE